MRQWLARVRDTLQRDRVQAELDEELRFHQEQLERDARSEGVDPEEAVWVARRRLGNVTRVRERARDRWSMPVLESVVADVRYAIRGLRSPGALQRRIVLETMRLAMAGMALGLLGAWALARLIEGMLFGVASWDPATFAAALATLTAVAALAGYLPARRISRLNPVEALRAE